MLITPDLHNANKIEKRLSLSLGADVLDAGLQLFVADRRKRIHHRAKTNTRKRSSRVSATIPAKLAEALNSFRERMKHYRQERVYPTLPDWPVVCFYNMSKRRGEHRNWYALPFDERRKLMKGHANVGREFAGKVKQLITGSTGLDDAEWGVTLFARDTFQIKAIVYKMRVRSGERRVRWISANFTSAFNCRSTNCFGACSLSVLTRARIRFVLTPIHRDSSPRRLRCTSRGIIL